MKLAIDAMSGDLGSHEVVEACKMFVKDHGDVTLYVVGKQEELEKLKDLANVEIVDAREVVKMTDSPLGVRRQKESSMVKALMMARKDEVDGVVSCGSTGAFFTGAMLFVKRLEGVERSCLMAVLPTFNSKGSCLLDVGANAENTAEQLRQFAIMGSVYAKYVRHINKPSVRLLNIGAEDHKGDQVHQDAYKLLKEEKAIQFDGNIEGRELLDGNCDVIVSDGFAGNIALKSMEGTALGLMKVMKKAMLGSTKSKLGALLIKDNLKKELSAFDYKSVGGALMMGFSKAIVKAHGGSDARAVRSAMELAYTMVAEDVVTKMKEGLTQS